MKRLILALLFLTLFLPARTTAQSAIVSASSGAWSSATTWTGGIMPSAASMVTIAAGHIVTAADATIAGLTVHGELRYAASATLSSTGNVLIYGKLSMKPSTAQVVHTLRFVNVNEAAFVGSGMEPLATDVGLWVLGTLDIAGTVKTAWTHVAGIAKGATQITLASIPVGWQVGDTVSIVPTEPITVGVNSWNGFDLSTITAISGATVTLSAPTLYAHPAVTNPFDNDIYTAEVLNLSRNVRIEGTPGKRAHVFIRSTLPQSIRYADLRYLAPRKPTSDGYTASITGRYGLHFHHNGDGSRGSIVEGVVVRDSGGHAFVPHASHGITFKDTISYSTYDEAYWWDAPPCNVGCSQVTINDSHDITIDHAVAARVLTHPNFRGYRLAGFVLGKGDGLSLRNSVAVGVQGNTDASGYEWPEVGQAVWVFENNVSHNNKVDGIFTWQNTDGAHVIEDFVAYHNTEAGIDHGAYRNAYQYTDIYLLGNGIAFISRAASGGALRADGYAHAIERVYMDGTFKIAEHNLPYIRPTLVKDCIATRIVISEASKPTPGKYDFVNCTKPDGTPIEPSDFAFSFAWPNSLYRVQRPDRTAYQITGAQVLSTIAPFYTASLSPIAQQIADLLEQYPAVRQELLEAGVIP